MQRTRDLSGFARGSACFAALLMLVSLAPAQETKPAKPAEKPGTTRPAAPKATTLDNLQTAYEAERSAHERYVAYAKKADEEGCAPVASLFRAAARSEEIHANNHAEVIKKMGGTPKGEVKKQEAKSTTENLAMAVIAENLESDLMYPAFIKQGKEEDNKDAVQAFTYAQQSEKNHATLYKQALDNFNEWKTGKKDFFVCGVCGNVVVKVDFEKCPVCFAPKSKYEKIN